MIDAWITQLRKGLLEYCVLTVLSGGESYGYEIVAALGKIEEFSVTESTVYPILARLRGVVPAELRIPMLLQHIINIKIKILL